ncbi:MAG: HAD family hydrolase [Nanoarchaeota archaeon]|nr:HAD family hydrolase [Nanoarchaeota archaeon]
MNFDFLSSFLDLFSSKRLLFDYVIWDVDGTLYDDHAPDRLGERNLFSYSKRLGEFDADSLQFWKLYPELISLMKKIPKNRQGIITNGYPQVQNDKLTILGVHDLVNPDLIFSSYGVAQDILMADDHPMQVFAMRNGEYGIDNIVLETQKPKGYMFSLLKEKIGDASVVYIGNRWYDVAAANRAAVPCIYMADHCALFEREDPVFDGRLKTYAQIHKGDIPALENLLFKKSHL